MMKTIRRTMKIRNPKSKFRNPPQGFTLVELMVVVVIIGILAALVLPAIYQAVVKAREAKVIVEIKGLETGIGAFKSKYGVEPPSQISIYLKQAGWTSNTAAMATIRNIWPQFDFTMAGGSGSGTIYPAFWDTIAVKDANGNFVINLNSGECLFFFLGGVIDVQGAGQQPFGFAKNPKWPFSPRSAVANREGPFFEFSDISRVRDIDGNGMNEWYDSLPGQTNPYLYFSSYDGQGYRLAELPNNGTAFQLTSSIPSLHDVYRVSSTSLNPPATPSSPLPGTSAAQGAQRPQGFQIISPGYDTNYGSGGVFNSNLVNSGLVDSTGAADTAAFDNLTNFNPGRLKP